MADHLGGGNWTLIAEHTEVESGKHADRPELIKAMDTCRRTGARLLIAKLDRLSRDVHFLSGLQKAGIEFVAADMPSANRFTVHIMAALAEHERELISAQGSPGRSQGPRCHARRLPRPHAGLAAGPCGRPEPDRGPCTRLGADLQTAGHSSLRKLGRGLAERHIRTLRGGQWTAAAVRNLLLQIGNLDPAQQRG